ncbi:UbiD family decarboxylase [Candidatus Methanocrinis natronophilus]|uniref:Anhydromevalonate phosphate decarboxylase n=1 Tax=Candidatus Methanocrinis natronophilus TaxID=3033396 RepID=A0ABT5X930_9EURY|nr:UbiD family decarboxylase [Candidatus Methanocrinis natronophilus]MDF0591087.1 UbiD family decarboxylase [Candidatus Methanocrinis natronophilus]
MSFRGFLHDLQESGLLLEVDRPVSPVLEASALSVGAGPILFNNVDGKKCCMNVLGTRDLLARALSTSKEEMARDLAGIDLEGGWIREVDSSPFMEVVCDPDLTVLPILTHFRGDGGPYITSGIVVSAFGGKTNAAVHRMMVIGKDRVAARLVPGRHTHMLLQEALAAGERLPVGIAIGVDPAVLIAASTRVPLGKEFQYASALSGDPVELVPLENGVSVPHAEIVFEGYIDDDREKEGPFVDITGTRDFPRMEPVIHLTKMMMREVPIYHGLLPSAGEHKMLMGIPYEPLIFRAASKVTDVRNVLLTEGGCSYLHAVVQIRKRDEAEPRRVIEAAFEAHKSLKHVIVVDEDIDIYSLEDLEYAVATRVKGDEDAVIYPNVRGSTLDPRSADGITTKMGIDATMTLGEVEKFIRIRPETPP